MTNWRRAQRVFTFLPSNPIIYEPPHAGLRQNKIIQEKYKKGNDIPKVFGLIALFVSVAVSDAKYILTETAVFEANLLHHKKISKTYPDNIPNFTNNLASNIDTVNYIFTLK